VSEAATEAAADAAIPGIVARGAKPTTSQAPLYVAWQITNECNLACLHCIEESGPGKAFADELDAGQVFSIIDQLMDSDVPYLSFSGGEPMLHPQFFAMVERVCSRGAELKIETNGHYLSPENCARLRELEVKAVQVSLDGASPRRSTGCACAAISIAPSKGLRNLRAAGVPVEINFSPGAVQHRRDRRGRRSRLRGWAPTASTPGRTMYTGNAVKAWRHLEVSDSDYERFFDVLRQKVDEYRGRMRVYFHEAGLLEELRFRLKHPAALLIVLPNGLVKLINALPFICGDFRKQTLARDLGELRRSWRDPRVAAFVDDLAADPGRTRTLHQWVHL
jgi:MoaA/NifB/PqqE/SkfB family radical SAM enzyme